MTAVLLFPDMPAADAWVLGLAMGAAGAWWACSHAWWLVMHRAWVAAHERRRRRRMRALHGTAGAYRRLWRDIMRLIATGRWT